MISIEHFKDVVVVLVDREFKSRYKNTVIGMVWSVISPLMFLAVFYLMFKLVFNLGIPRYASFVFTGILAWMWLQSALNEAVASITSSGSMVSQPGFPLAALPIVSVAVNLINFLVALPLLAAILLIEGAVLTSALFLLPLLVLIQFILILGLAYLSAAANVYFRDVRYILPVILQIGYYITPIFYDSSAIPQKYLTFLMWNPMTHVVSAYREVLMNGKTPNLQILLWLAATSLGVLLVGYYYFKRASYRFLEEL
jgi:ABC-type polysaccharide/polyol phosphate export permease